MTDLVGRWGSAGTVRLMQLRHLVAVALAAGLLGASSASAETIHVPESGFSVQEDQSATFDWAWDSDQYASHLYFADTADGTDPIWFGANNTGRPRVRVTDLYGSPFLSSNATFIPKRWSLTPGTWYWRLCSFTASGEDDKCYFRMPPRLITITAAPAPPPPPPIATPTPTPSTVVPVAAPAPASDEQPEQRESFTRSEAADVARSAIETQFGYARVPKGTKAKCAKAATVSQVNRCRVSWTTAKYRFAGDVRVGPVPFTPADIAEAKDDPSVYDDNDFWFTLKIRRTNRATGATKTITAK